jgi:hypothetical protein
MSKNLAIEDEISQQTEALERLIKTSVAVG